MVKNKGGVNYQSLAQSAFANLAHVLMHTKENQPPLNETLMNICILLIMVYQIPLYHSNEFNFELLDIPKLKLFKSEIRPLTKD